MTKTPQAIFFDWDGTLVDTLPWLLTAHNHVRTHLGHEPWSVEDFKKVIRYSSRELYGRLYGEREEEAHTVLRAFMDANHLENLEVLPDALPLLEYLHESGIPAGIISNKREAVSRPSAGRARPLRAGAGGRYLVRRRFRNRHDDRTGRRLRRRPRPPSSRQRTFDRRIRT